MNARKMIEQEYAKAGGDVSRLVDPSPYDLAAERVIERLQKRVEELEKQIEVMDKSDADWDKERYRDRLDRMVGSLVTLYHEMQRDPAEELVEHAQMILAVIDEEVEKLG